MKELYTIQFFKVWMESETFKLMFGLNHLFQDMILLELYDNLKNDSYICVVLLSKVYFSFMYFMKNSL